MSSRAGPAPANVYAIEPPVRRMWPSCEVKREAVVLARALSDDRLMTGSSR